MTRNRVSVQQLAGEASMDLDEALITLWDAGFTDVKGPGDFLERGDANRARRSLGLATRRELASSEYWQKRLQLERADFDELIESLGVKNPYEGGRLRKKVIHRLKAEIKARGVAQLDTDERAVTLTTTDTHAPFAWEEIGHKRDMRYLTVGEIADIHDALVQDFLETSDPIDPPGVRSQSLLESAAYRPQTTLDGIAKYTTVEMAAASLIHALVHDHPFYNGNKRTALVSMLVFLDENAIVVTCDESELFKLVLQLAQHALTSGPRPELSDRETLEVARWLKGCSRLVEKGDRAIPWRRLRRILADYGCVCELATGGSKVNINRPVGRPGGLLRKPKTVLLKTQTAYHGEGREVDKNTINMIRHELELDDEHGTDSKSFYDSDSVPLSDFIIRYRKTLQRLARL